MKYLSKHMNLLLKSRRIFWLEAKTTSFFSEMPHLTIDLGVTDKNKKNLRWYAWRGRTDSETKFFFQMCAPSLGARCGVFSF